MKPIDDILTAFELYYSTNTQQLTYSPTQSGAIRKRLAWISPKYARALYDEVIRTHASTFRSLPDMAIIDNAMKGLDRPESYDAPPKQIEDHSELTFEMIQKEHEEQARRDNEPNHYERERIRMKVAKGEATQHEAWWIECIDNGGQYRAMTERFKAEHAGIRRW